MQGAKDAAAESVRVSELLASGTPEALAEVIVDAAALQTTAKAALDTATAERDDIQSQISTRLGKVEYMDLHPAQAGTAQAATDAGTLATLSGEIKNY
jgi:hypothetical protein